MANAAPRDYGVAARRANRARALAELLHYGKQVDRGEEPSLIGFNPSYQPEHGVPLPPIDPRQCRFPFDRLREGESFVVLDKRILNRAYAEARRRGLQVTSAKTDDGQYRVWSLGPAPRPRTTPPVPEF